MPVPCCRCSWMHRRSSARDKNGTNGPRSARLGECSVASGLRGPPILAHAAAALEVDLGSRRPESWPVGTIIGDRMDYDYLCGNRRRATYRKTPQKIGSSTLMPASAPAAKPLPCQSTAREVALLWMCSARVGPGGSCSPHPASSAPPDQSRRAAGARQCPPGEEATEDGAAGPADSHRSVQGTAT